MANEYKLRIGSYGWQHKTWNNSFYPEDLPMEWQFAYYANEYSVIMIPWPLLQQDFEMFKQGIEDSDEACQILFEFPVDDFKTRTNNEIRNTVQTFLDKVSFIGERNLGLVLVFSNSDLCDLSQAKLNFFYELLQKIAETMNLCVEVKTAKTVIDSVNLIPEEILTILAKTNTALCRYNDVIQNYPEQFTSVFNLTVCDLMNTEPKKMRKIVENSLLGECAGSTNVLIFRTDNPNHEQMNTALVISDLL